MEIKTELQGERIFDFHHVNMFAMSTLLGKNVHDVFPAWSKIPINAVFGLVMIHRLT